MTARVRNPLASMEDVMKHWRWIVALAMAAGAGCTGSGATTQVLEGHLSGSGAQVVRAVSGDTVIAATQVKADGSWTLELPKGGAYRLGVLTAGGAGGAGVA